MAKRAAVFGNETWVVAELNVTIEGTGEREILSICGPVLEQGMRIMRANQ